VPGFFQKLFRVGGVPEELRAQLESEGLLGSFEYIPVHYRFSGHVPGLVSLGERRSYGGALLFTTQRIVGTLSVIPGAAGRAIDASWTTGDAGAVHLTIDEAGAHVTIDDLSRVSPEFSGSQSLDYAQQLPAELLTRLPKRDVRFDIPREYVLRLAGVPVRPPKRPTQP